MEVMTVADLGALIGVSVNRIEYAERLGRLPEPTRWHGRKVYSVEDADVVRTYFEGKKPWHKVKDGAK